MCQANPDAVLEFDTNGHLIAMTPTGGGDQQPQQPTRHPDGAGGATRALSAEQRRGFPPLCPDLVAEMASPSDEGPRGVTSPRRKVGLYQANGAQLGCLLLPEERAVEIWRGGQEGIAELVVELDEIWGVCPPARDSFASSPQSIPCVSGWRCPRALIWGRCGRADLWATPEGLPDSRTRKTIATDDSGTPPAQA